ncbi:hypothetical protein Leryth_024614 [Lithospermum erythrorhizon]|nr:hypothetical protein Leryth_024614 [Lithospermum erythrorhizon]
MVITSDHDYYDEMNSRLPPFICPSPRSYYDPILSRRRVQDRIQNTSGFGIDNVEDQDEEHGIQENRVLIEETSTWGEISDEEEDYIDYEEVGSQENIETSNLDDILLLEEAYIDYFFNNSELKVMGSHENTGLLDESIIMKNLETRVFQEHSNNDENTCAVCLCDYEKDEEIGDLHCGHHFHVGCIMKWLFSKNSCPMCRAIIVVVDHPS